MDDDDDEEEMGGIFDDGHWVWDELTQGLVFISDLPPVESEAVIIPTKAPTGTIEFRDNVDVIEQIRFRRRYQRKFMPGQAEVISLQDVKDIALFTAPISIQSVVLINLLHTVTADRFLRALVFYIQYYLQTAELMSRRMKELEVKLRTVECEQREAVYMDNLTDLRVLVAKEYSVLIMGAGDMRKFHHMGPAKKRRSLTDMDARLIETLLRMCVQIVWLALGRKSFNQIELEIHRMFKSETFNMVEHTLKTHYVAKMAAPERLTLLGRCNKLEKKLKTRSPMLKDIFCLDIDYRMMALGVVKMEGTNARLQFLQLTLTAPEEVFVDRGITLGIIGLNKDRFDTMLNEIKIPSTDKSRTTSIASGMLSSKSTSRGSVAGSRKSVASVRLFPMIEIPAKEPILNIPTEFPLKPEVEVLTTTRAMVERQRRRWLNRFRKLVSGGRGGGRATSSK